MRKGARLGGYTVVTEPTNANAGMSQWARAERDGKLYFMKRFLSPKFPTPNGLGTPDGREKRRKDCEAFEQLQLAVIERLSSTTAGAGHLITPRVFFRVGPSYYKVTDLVEVDSGVSLGSCTPDDVAVAIRSLVASVRVVHQAGVVHSDLKPDNVLFERTSGGRLACKLIDFDESYLSGEPPTTMRLAGDPYFYSPEMLGYIQPGNKVPPGDLTTASDIFALGVLLHLFMTGETVGIAPAHAYPCEAVRAGETPRLHSGLADSVVGSVLTRMLAAQPSARPDLAEVLNSLGRSALRTAIAATRATGAMDDSPIIDHPCAGDAEDMIISPRPTPSTEGTSGGENDPHAGTGSQPPDGARLRSTMGHNVREPDPGD